MDRPEILSRVEKLIEGGRALLAQTTGDIEKYVPEGEFAGWRARVLNFLVEEAGDKNTYTREFADRVKVGYVDQVEQGIGILQALRADMKDGDFR